MKIDNYHPFPKGYMVAFFDAIIPVEWGDLRVCGLKLFQKNGKRWVGFSGKTVEKDGEKKYFTNEKFEESMSMTSFSIDALKAIDDHAMEKSKQKVEQKVEQRSPQYQEQEIPF